MKKLLIAVCAAALLSAGASAGPDDKSKFSGAAYAPQKTVYEFNQQVPGDAIKALGYLRNHLAALKEFGGYEGTHLVVVAHGNGLHAFARENRAMFPDAYDKIKALKDQGVSFYICRNAARGRDYKPDDFYDLFTVIPAGMTELAKWQNKGYSYATSNFGKRITKAELAKMHAMKDDHHGDKEGGEGHKKH
jgi:uncharacterized protein